MITDVNRTRRSVSVWLAKRLREARKFGRRSNEFASRSISGISSIRVLAKKQRRKSWNEVNINL